MPPCPRFSTSKLTYCLIVPADGLVKTARKPIAPLISRLRPVPTTSSAIWYGGDGTSLKFGNRSRLNSHEPAGMDSPLAFGVSLATVLRTGPHWPSCSTLNSKLGNALPSLSVTLSCANLGKTWIRVEGKFWRDSVLPALLTL